MKLIRNILFLHIVVLLSTSINAQDTKSIVQTNAQDERFIAEVIQSLDEVNPLRVMLEAGYRGDGIHYGWMDEMKKLGIKQVSYVIDFEWQDYNLKSLTAKETSFHPLYYQYDVLITDEKILQQIKGSKFEKALESKALSIAEKNLRMIMKKLEDVRDASGIVYENLLDDERLPLVRTDSPKINYEVSDALAQDCNYWNAAVGVKSVNLRAGNKDEKNTENIIEGIECLLKLEGDKSRGAFSGATHFAISETFPSATVEVCALFYVSKLFYQKYAHANGVALRYTNYTENRALNSDDAVKKAYESYRTWFEKVKKIGIEEARKQKLDPLEGSTVRWY